MKDNLCYKCYPKGVSKIECIHRRYYIWTDSPINARCILHNKDLVQSGDEFVCGKYPEYDGLFPSGEIKTVGDMRKFFESIGGNK